MSKENKHIVFHPIFRALGLFFAIGILMLSGMADTQPVYEADTTEQASDEESPEEIPAFSIDEAVTSSLQFSVAFQSFLIVALPEFSTTQFEGYAINWLSQLNPEQVRVLFRLIISPNAP